MSACGLAGFTKARAAVDLWLKEVAPSPRPRKWFAHDPAKWERFVQRYREELERREQAVDLLLRKSRLGPVTLIYAARDTEHNGRWR